MSIKLAVKLAGVIGRSFAGRSFCLESGTKGLRRSFAKLELHKTIRDVVVTYEKVFEVGSTDYFYAVARLKARILNFSGFDLFQLESGRY